MVPILVVQDPNLDISLLNGRATPPDFGWQIVGDTNEALERLGRQQCALLLTNTNSTMNGSADFLSEVKARDPKLPIVLVASDSGDGIRFRDALSADVAGSLPQSTVADDLPSTIRFLLDKGPSSSRFCHTFNNSPELIPLVVGQVRKKINDWPFEDEHGEMRMTVALSEALDNALFHGNLELDSSLRNGDGSGWREESQRRRGISPYQDRRIRFQATIDPSAATFVIRDEGSGFDKSRLLDCTDSQNLELCSGRGLMLMQMYMDDVQFNAIGNEVTLIKYRPSA